MAFQTFIVTFVTCPGEPIKKQSSSKDFLSWSGNEMTWNGNVFVECNSLNLTNKEHEVFVDKNRRLFRYLRDEGQDCNNANENFKKTIFAHFWIVVNKGIDFSFHCVASTPLESCQDQAFVCWKRGLQISLHEEVYLVWTVKMDGSFWLSQAENT